MPGLIGSEEIVLSYSRQMVICESVREIIRETLVTSSQLPIKLKTSGIPTTDGILRAVSVLPKMNTEEQLRMFIIDHVLAALRLTENEKERVSSLLTTERSQV